MLVAGWVALLSADLTMPAHYIAADFPKPKVKGLAIHNAKKLRNATQDRSEKGYTYPPPEVQSYCLYVVASDCSVMPVASAPTSADFAPFLKKTNLALLARKYSGIGFVEHRHKGAANKEPEWSVIAL